MDVNSQPGHDHYMYSYRQSVVRKCTVLYPPPGEEACRIRGWGFILGYMWGVEKGADTRQRDALTSNQLIRLPGVPIGMDSGVCGQVTGS